MKVDFVVDGRLWVFVDKVVDTVVDIVVVTVVVDVGVVVVTVFVDTVVVDTVVVDTVVDVVFKVAAVGILSSCIHFTGGLDGIMISFAIFH